jgi:hypothetical protein
MTQQTHSCTKPDAGVVFQQSGTLYDNTYQDSDDSNRLSNELETLSLSLISGLNLH